MKNKTVCKSIEKLHTNCQILFSTKWNTFTERFDKYNDWITLQTRILLRRLRVIIMVVSMLVPILSDYGEFIYKVYL